MNKLANSQGGDEDRTSLIIPLNERQEPLMDTQGHRRLGTRSPAHFFEQAQCRDDHPQSLRLDLMFGDSSKFFGAKSSNKMDSCAEEYSTWDQKHYITIKTKLLYGLQMDSSGNLKTRLQTRLECMRLPQRMSWETCLRSHASRNG